MEQINPQITPQREQQSIQEAQFMNQQMQTQEVPALPEEKLAINLSAWGARKLLKTVKPKSVKVPKKELLKKYGIEDKPVEIPEGIKPEEMPKTFNERKEAVKLEKADLNDFSTTDSYQMNFDTIESEDDVKAVIAQMAEKNKAEITEARRGVIGDEQLKALAKDVGGDPDFILKVMQREQGELLSPEYVLATRQVIEQSAVRLKELSQLVVRGEASEKDRLEFSKQWTFHQQFTNQFMGMRAEYGRGLRAFGIPQGSDQMQMDRINEMVSRVHSGLDVDEMAKQIDLAPTSKGVTDMVHAQDGLFKKAGNVFIENFINSILSGVKTHIINTSGTALRMGMDTIDTYVAARVGKDLPSPEEKVALDEWKAGFFGLINGFDDALAAGAQAFKSTEPYGGISKFEGMNKKYISSDYLGLKQQSVAGTAIDVLGSVIRFPTERLMGMEDAFFKSLAERQKLTQTAYRHASRIAEAQGLDDKQARGLLQDLMENPTEEMMQEATDYGLTVTFQNPLGKLGQQFQKVAYSHPAVTMVMPFVKTPTNLMKQGFLERTPLAVITRQYKDDIAAGGYRGQMARAKMYTGTAMLASASMMAANGMITGSDPSDPKEREAKYATGWRPFSIRTTKPDGNYEYIGYQRAEPFSYIFGTIADFTEIMSKQDQMQMGEEEEHYADRIAASWAAAVSNATLDRTFMTGIRDLMQTASDPKRYMGSYITNLINASVPYAGARRDITRLFDDTKRTTDNWMDKIKQNTPGLSQDLPKNLDAYGEEMHYDAVLNPWPVVDGKTDDVIEEVARLAESTMKVAVSKPSRLINGVKLKAKEYHDLIKLARKDLEVDGKNFKATLKEVMDDESYKEAIDEDKVEILARVKNSFDQAARFQLMMENESLMDRVLKKRLAKGAKYKALELGITEQEAMAEMKNDIISEMGAQ